MDIVMKNIQIVGIGDLPSYKRCVVLGACLTSSDEKKLLQNAGYKLKGITRLVIHRMLVKAVKDNDVVSRRTEHLFLSRYVKRVQIIDGCSEEQLILVWHECLEENDYGWLLWILLTGVKYSEDFIDGVLDDFYSFQHQVSREASMKTNRIGNLNKKINTLTKKLKLSKEREREHKRRQLTSEKKYDLSKKQIISLTKKLKNAESNKERFEESHDSFGSGRLLIQKYEKLLSERDFQIKKYKDKCISTCIEHDALKIKHKSNSDAMLEVLNVLRAKELDCEKCSNRDLCDRKVLLVGGIIRLESIYRNLVIGTGGDFKYHDGKSNTGEKLLQEKVQWADVVLCPVDVNSHRAALGVKKICKKMKKPFFMLRSSSVTSISKALDQIASSAR